MKSPPSNMKFLFCLADMLDGLIARYNLANPLANGIGVLHVFPTNGRAITHDSLGDLGNHMNFAARSGHARFAAIAQTHKVEHGFLSCRLRLFVTRQHGQD